ncbi:MAG: acetyl-CoA carboxylase biotin carboxyl carrier protein [candidate division WOR-3 bacterium]
MGLTTDDVTQILKFIDDSNFDELHLQTGDLKLIVRRRGSTGAVRELESAAKEVSSSVPPVEPSLGAGREEDDLRGSRSPQKEISRTEAVSAGLLAEDGLIAIKSPMLGTFYRAPKPEAAPFVEVGTVINVGDTLCIIEVMKLFSTITAEVRGRIAKICAENGQLVEYQQTLFLVEPQEKMEKVSAP